MEINGSDVGKEEQDRDYERTNRKRRHQEVTDIPRKVLDGGRIRIRDTKGTRKMNNNRNEMNAVDEFFKVIGFDPLFTSWAERLAWLQYSSVG
jgi:hypothetical protein